MNNIQSVKPKYEFSKKNDFKCPGFIFLFFDWAFLDHDCDVMQSKAKTANIVVWYS